MKRSALIFGFSISILGLNFPIAVSPAFSMVVQDLPTVETILDNSVKAVGGRAALDNIKTLHTVMAMTADGRNLDMDASWSRKGGRLTTAKSPMGDVVLGTDGTTAWMKNPMGPGYSLAPDNTKGQLKMAAILMTVVDPTCMEKKDIEGVTVIAKESFQGKECYKLSAPKKDDEAASFMFFEVESGLPAGSMQEDGKGSMTFGDWKRVEGVLFFHSMKMAGSGKRGDISGELKVLKIEVNKPDESAFALPEDVKKLADKKKTDANAPEIRIEDLDKADQKAAQDMQASLKSIDLQTLKQMEQSMGMGIEYMPENKKKVNKFYLQEIKKEIARRG